MVVSPGVRLNNWRVDMRNIARAISVIGLGCMMLVSTAQAGEKNTANGFPPKNAYKYEGVVSSVDKANRLLTIDGKTYSAAVGMKIKNLPDKLKYTGLKYIDIDTNVFFNLTAGTEKKPVPSIREMWVIPN